MTEPYEPSDVLVTWDVSASPKTIVVIDDDIDLLELMVLVLQSAGHRACGTTKGRDGLRLVADQLAEVVVLDFRMPDMNGAQVGQALRANFVTKDIKILMCSGTPETTIRASFIQYDGYLAKPADGVDFVRAIEAL